MSYDRNLNYSQKNRQGFRFSTQGQRFEKDNYSKSENFRNSGNNSFYASQDSKYGKDNYRKSEICRNNRNKSFYATQDTRYDKDSYGKSENYRNNRKNSFYNTRGNKGERRIGQTFRERNIPRNNSNYQEAYKRRGHCNKLYGGGNFNSQRYKHTRSQNNEINDVRKILSEKVDISSTLNKTSNDFISNENGKSGNKEPVISNGDLSNSFIVDPLPAPVENTGSSSQYICKSNLEFPRLELSINSGKQSSDSSDSETDTRKRKRHFSQSPSSSLSQKPEVSRKRNVSAASSLDADVNQKKFKNDLFGEELEIFEKSHLKVPKDIDGLSSQPQLQVQSKTGVKQEIELNLELDHCYNDLNLSQSQPFTPFSIPCGQDKIKNTDEIECSSQESKIALTNFIFDFNSSPLSPAFDQDLKPKRECTTIADHNCNSPSKNPSYNHDSQSNIENFLDITYDTRKTHTSNDIDAQKGQRDKIPVCSQASQCNESESSSQECDTAVSVLPNVNYLKNLSKSMSDKGSFCSSQNTSDSLSVENEKSLDPSESLAIVTKESNNLNKSCLNENKLNPLTSTQYGPRKKNLYIPQLSPLTGCIRNSEIENSLINDVSHLDSSVVLCNINKLKNTAILPSTQPFENLGINKTISGNNFENLKVKMEELFNISDSDNETIMKSLQEVTCNKNTNCDSLTDVIPISTETLDLSVNSDENESLHENVVNTFENIHSSVESVEALVHDKENTSLKSQKNYRIASNKNNDDNCEEKRRLDENRSQNSNIHPTPCNKTNEKTSESRIENSNGVCEDKKEHDLNLSSPNQIKKEVCLDFDSKVGKFLKTLKNLFEEKKEKYLSKNIQTVFKVRIIDMEGSDKNEEIKTFKLTDRNNIERQNPQNILKLLVKSSSDIEHTSLKGSDSITCASSSDEVHSFKVKKKQEKKSVDSKDSDDAKKNKEKNKKSESFLHKDNWWENVVSHLPDCVLETSSKVIDDLCSSTVQQDVDMNNVSDEGSKPKNEVNECDESKAVSLQSTVTKKKKKKKKKGLGQINSYKDIYDHFAPVVELDVPSDKIPHNISNTKVKKKLNMSNTKFKKKLNMSNTKFKKKLNMSNAKVKKKLKTANKKVKNKLNTSSTKVKKNVDIPNTKVNKKLDTPNTEVEKRKLNTPNTEVEKRKLNTSNTEVKKKKLAAPNTEVKKKKLDTPNKEVKKKKKLDTPNKEVKKKKKLDTPNTEVKKKKLDSPNTEVKKKKLDTINRKFKKKLKLKKKLKTSNKKVTKGLKQHQICLNELSICDDSALSNVKKTLKKNIKKCKDNSQKSLTPPFKFKKIKPKSGTKRPLLSNASKENIL